MPTDETRQPPLPDDTWSQLVSLIRRYAPAGAVNEWEANFKLRVFEAVSLLRDRDTNPETWSERLILLIEAQFAPPSYDDPLMRELTLAIVDMQSARVGPPRPAEARKRLRRVVRQAEALSNAIADAIADPWLNREVGLEMGRAVIRHRGEAPAPLPRNFHAFVRKLHRSGEAPFAAILETFSLATEARSDVTDAARRGIELMEGQQFKGRPRDAGARLPAEFLAAIARQCAPAPPRRRGLERWREAIVTFVCRVLAETGLQAINREFLEDCLK